MLIVLGIVLCFLFAGAIGGLMAAEKERSRKTPPWL